MKKVVVTGGSGRLGQFVIRDLLDRDYSVLNLDRVAPREKLCMTWQVDLRHAGDLFEALRGAYGIIHLGAYQAPNLAPDAETLSNNVSATYNVLRAAADIGVKRVVLASSTAAFGFIYASKLWAPKYLPMDELHPSTPQDSYGLSKALGEQIADSIVSVHRDMTVSSLRFPGVNFDLSYESFRDRELVAEANKSQLEVAPIDGPTTAKTFAGLYELNPTLIAKLKDILIPKK